MTVSPGHREPPSHRSSASILDMITDRAACVPDAPAVSAGDGSILSYAGLCYLAAKLADRLRARGVGPEDRVGICWDRSPELVVALLGTLAAGACYVPLDPALPGRRLRSIAQDCAMRIAVASPRHAHVVPQGIALAGFGGIGSAARTRTVQRFSSAQPSSAAYAVYTSGSTGEPKGVVIPHLALSWLAASAGYLDAGPGDVFALASSPSFDALAFECWVGLAWGACLRVIPTAALLDPPRLRAELRGGNVTVLYVTASLLHLYAAEAPDFAQGLRVLIFGGQVSDPRAVARVRAVSSPERMLQVYGPTETTVWCSRHEVGDRDDAWIPLGLPLPGATMTVLDDGLEPVPDGVAGQIHIGGDGLARGYLNRPDLTAERFVPDPSGAGRLYRTGDLARQSRDGRLEFLGRADDQVKIRGYRVELGEIESVLRTHPGVAGAAVTARPAAGGDLRLTAYVVPASAVGISPADLRSFLAKILPAYMLPSVFVPLRRMPLTTAGKLDRSALPAPPTSRGRLARTTRAVAVPGPGRQDDPCGTGES